MPRHRYHRLSGGDADEDLVTDLFHLESACSIPRPAEGWLWNDGDYYDRLRQWIKECKRQVAGKGGSTGDTLAAFSPARSPKAKSPKKTSPSVARAVEEYVPPEVVGTKAERAELKAIVATEQARVNAATEKRIAELRKEAGPARRRAKSTTKSTKKSTKKPKAAAAKSAAKKKPARGRR